MSHIPTVITGRHHGRHKNHGFSHHSTPRRQSFDWCFIMRHSYTRAEETKQMNSLSYIDFLMTDFPERKALTVPFL